MMDSIKSAFVSLYFVLGTIAQAAPPRPTLPDKFLEVPLVRQTTEYSCGAAALAAILHYWRVFSGSETELFIPLGTTQNDGTAPDSIVRVAKSFGLSAEEKTRMTLDDLELAHKSGSTVILNIQAWKDKGSSPWSLTWENGHYVVLVGLDENFIYVMDPSVSAQYGYIPHKEFLERWHDYEEKNNVKEFNYELGIVIRGKKSPLKPLSLERIL